MKPKKKLKAAVFNTNERSIVNMTIGDSWNSVVSQKFTWSLDYDGVHYGDYSEWYSSFRILTNKIGRASCRERV